MNAMHRLIQPDAAGSTLVTIGVALMGVGAVQTAGLRQDVWSDPWFDGGCALVAPGALLVITMIFSWWRSWRRKSSAIRRESEPDALMPDHEEQTSSPLHLRLADENWRLAYNAVWVFGLAVSVTNLTGNPIILVHYQLRSESGETQRPPLAEEVRAAVSDSKAKLTAEHNSELFTGEIMVPPGTSMTRWHIDTAYVPSPEGGRPHCTFQLKDTLDNIYELDIPARPPRTFRSLAEPGLHCALAGSSLDRTGVAQGCTRAHPGTTRAPASYRAAVLSQPHGISGTLDPSHKPADRRAVIMAEVAFGSQECGKSA